MCETWNRVFSLMKSHQKSLFYRPHGSQVLGVWAARFFQSTQADDWQDQDCSLSFFQFFSLSLALSFQCCSRISAIFDFHFHLAMNWDSSDELLSFSCSFGNRTYVKPILKNEKTLITESHPTHNALHLQSSHIKLLMAFFFLPRRSKWNIIKNKGKHVAVYPVDFI